MPGKFLTQAGRNHKNTMSDEATLPVFLYDIAGSSRRTRTYVSNSTRSWWPFRRTENGYSLELRAKYLCRIKIYLPDREFRKEEEKSTTET